MLIQILLLIGAVSACWRDTSCANVKASFPGPWEANMFSPTSRTVQPKRILDLDHNVLGRFPGRVPCLCSNGSAVIFDFGLEVGGIVTLEYTALGSGTLGLAFSEASNFTGPNSDESNGGSGPDLALNVPVSSGRGVYTMPLDKLRGGFRYLTVFATSAKVNINGVKLEIAFQPTWSDLRAYGGYFHSSDDLLNRVWYACAYTIQTTSVPPDTGRVYPLPSGWENNASLGIDAPSVLVDGAKRDRSAWAGDLLTAIPALLVSTGDLETAKASIQVEFDYQSNTGELPYAGPPLYFFGSDTYHMTTLCVVYDYVLFSGDTGFLKGIWAKYTKAVDFITSKIDDTGLLSITGTANWGRAAISNGHTTDGNALMYRVLTTGATMAKWTGDESHVEQYTKLADALKAAMGRNWDESAGAFKNADVDASVHPEDGNSMAILYGVANTSQVARISESLTHTWCPIGAVSPEGYPDNIVPFPEGLEVKAHLAAQQSQRALDLIRRSWGWYLNNPNGTGSTAIEGYKSDGSFNYHNDGYDNAGSYPSHAHGWSAGPADALIDGIVGLRVASLGGKTWTLQPQWGDLKNAQGGFTTPLGKFSAGWQRNGRGYSLWVDVPKGTSGQVHLSGTITVDGRSQNTKSAGGISVSGGYHKLEVV